MRRLLIATLGILLLSAAATARQTGVTTAEQLIYGDSVANGWRDVSLANLTSEATAPVRSGTRSLSVRLGAFQSLSLRHDPLDSSIYTSLTFWIHGGSGGGQRLRVIATLDNTSQPPVTIAPLAANAWQQITLPLSSLGVAGKPNVTGFRIQETTGTTLQAFYIDDVNLTMLPPPAMVPLSVDAGVIARTANARHFGMHTALWDPIFESAATVSVLQDTGMQACAFPAARGPTTTTGPPTPVARVAPAAARTASERRSTCLPVSPYEPGPRYSSS